MPLAMTEYPHDVNSISPTPLDPDNLTIAGQPYMALALDHMIRGLYDNSHGTDVRQEDLKAIEAEIMTQHFERSSKNAKAMDRLRKHAIKPENNRVLSRDEAEGIMQMRAGVARITPALRLLARVPELEAVELSKATRPLCVGQYAVATWALDSAIRSLKASNRVDTTVMTGAEAVPYRYILDEENGTIITKRRLASVALDGVNLEIICRDSYRGASRGGFDGSVEYLRSKIGPVEVDLTPISAISYARVTRS